MDIYIVPECSIEGQVYTTCGTACPPTCKYDPSGCIQQCFVGCQCPHGTVLDEANNRCVKKEYCGMSNTYNFNLLSYITVL